MCIKCLHYILHFFRCNFYSPFSTVLLREQVGARCPRTLRHVDCREWVSKHRPSDWNTLFHPISFFSMLVHLSVRLCCYFDFFSSWREYQLARYLLAVLQLNQAGIKCVWKCQRVPTSVSCVVGWACATRQSNTRQVRGRVRERERGRETARDTARERESD